MSSMLRTRFGIPGIVATVALVFAMTGGAFAAKYLITSTSQIKPSVLKKLKGAAGPAGPAGSTGATGAKGDTGVPGSPGADGQSVTGTSIAAGGTCGVDIKGVKYTLDGVSTNVCNGAKGAAGAAGAPGAPGSPGPEGSPWTDTGTLPPGETLTGVWTTSDVDLYEEGETPEISFKYVPISFGLPLSSAPARTLVKAGEETGTGACPGTVAEPKAAPGNLCLYTEIEAGLNGTSLGSPSPKNGAILEVLTFTNEAEPLGFTKGSWAVTAAP